MADDRRVFPTETVLELVYGKKDGNIKEIASYILGRPINCDACQKAAAPFAAAWLARWYPKFMEADYNAGDNWNAFVMQMKNKLGDNISLTPITGRLKTLASETLDAVKDAREDLMRQTETASKLEEKVREMEPLQGLLKNLQKKNDDLENKLKTMKTDMGALQRKVNEFQGKLPIDNAELMQTIKSAIKDGLKGMAMAAPVAQAGADGAAAPAAAAMPMTEEEWEARPSHATDDDEWG